MLEHKVWSQAIVVDKLSPYDTHEALKASNLKALFTFFFDPFCQTLDLADDRTKEQRKAIDDEYAFLGVKDPKVGGSKEFKERNPFVFLFL